MAFVETETWRAAPTPRAASHHAPPLVGPSEAWDLPLRRGAAILFSMLIHFVLLWFLIDRLADGTEAAARPEPVILSLIEIQPPGGPQQSASQAAPVKAPAPATPILAEVDLSRPAELPPPEWTMSSMRVLRPLDAAAAPDARTAGAGSAAGSGRGAPGLRQFIGFGDGIGGELLLDRAMLEAARQAAVRPYPEARGAVFVFLRVSPAGVVLAAEIRGGNTHPAIVAALRRELLGKRLFQVRSRIDETAMVALPPMSLTNATRAQ